MIYASLYEAAQQADRDWSAELRRTYGRAAGDARYDVRGRANPRLALLALRFRAACEVWLYAMRVADGRADREIPWIGV